MLAKLALAIFLMVNGVLQGPFGVAVKDAPFPSVEACEAFKDTDEGKKLHAYVLQYAQNELGAAATVVDECVPVDPASVKPKAEERGASMWPEWGNAS